MSTLTTLEHVGGIDPVAERAAPRAGDHDGIPMSRLIGVELRKSFDTRAGRWLLGTIVGLIQAFNAVANANPAEKADLLSGSISVAMNTTALGLIVAVPLLLAHAYLNSRTGEIIDSLEMASVKTLNIIMSATQPRPNA